jgi:hypothetical protein
MSTILGAEPLFPGRVEGDAPRREESSRDERTRLESPSRLESPVRHLDPFKIPPGYGFEMIPREKWFVFDEDEEEYADEYLESLMDRLLVWEPRRRGFSYVVTVDVSSGLGLDRSVIDVTRVGNLADNDEQVAQFVSSLVDPIELAYFIDPIGRFYCDDDDTEALVAIECNNHGYATQAELLQHCGYSNLFVWRHEDARDPKSRYTRAFGWFTTRRTRPVILARYYRAVTTLDVRTGLPDYRINSPHTMAEMQDFVSDSGALWEAEASRGAHDDCIMAGAIAVHVAQTLHFDTREPLAEQRRRLSEEKARRDRQESRTGARPDYQNSDVTFSEVTEGEDLYSEGSGSEGWY